MAKRMTKAAKKKRFYRVLLIVVIVLAILAAIAQNLRSQVASKFAAGTYDTPLTYKVSRGSISTTVSGSGSLADEDVQEILLHSSVQIDEILVDTGDTVQEGDLLATVNMSTVLSAMADVQQQLNALDDKIHDAAGDEVSENIKTAIAGRVKKLYAEKGDDVSTVMYEHGALALLSLDGHMAVTIENSTITSGDKVTVTTSDGKTYEGTAGKSGEILITDNGPALDDTVTVTAADGTVLGTGRLYIHEQLKITGFAGTVSKVYATENQKLAANKQLFKLTDTSFSANYQSLLQDRQELEEQLQRLIRVYQDGAVYAPMSGSISSIGKPQENTAPSQEKDYYSDFYISGFSSSQTVTSDESQSSDSGDEQTVLSICPGITMTVSISVDESSILSLSLDQSATITVNALDGDSFPGTVTAIDTTATSSAGVSSYTVTVTLDKDPDMLSGMSADVSIRTEGVDNALLIPSDALTQTRAKTYVYTGHNAETGELIGLTEVTTGMNNGELVEIITGLQEGDTVYYFEPVNFWFLDDMGFGGMRPGGHNR